MKRNKDLNELLEETGKLEEKEYFSTQEVLNILKITDTTLYRYIGKGYLNKTKVFGRTWFKGTDLIEFIHRGVQTNTVSK